MIIDMHTHLLGVARPMSKAQKPELLKAMERYGIDKMYVSGLDTRPNPSMDGIREYNDGVYEFKRENPD